MLYRSTHRLNNPELPSSLKLSSWSIYINIFPLLSTFMVSYTIMSLQTQTYMTQAETNQRWLINLHFTKYENKEVETFWPLFVFTVSCGDTTNWELTSWEPTSRCLTTFCLALCSLKYVWSNMRFSKWLSDRFNPLWAQWGANRGRLTRCSIDREASNHVLCN